MCVPPRGTRKSLPTQRSVPVAWIVLYCRLTFTWILRTMKAPVRDLDAILEKRWMHSLAVAAAMATLLAAAPAAADERLRSHEPPADTISCGHAADGALIGGVALPAEGDGYAIVGPWRHRGRRFAAPELVDLVRRVAARVAREHPGSVLAVGDLSRRGGGKVRGHRSHQSGRDVDLIYYAVGADGRPFAQDGYMGGYREDMWALSARAPRPASRIRPRHFDLVRNWALVRALVADEAGLVTKIVVSPRVERWLIEHAVRSGEKPALIARAAALMNRPLYVRGHNDHMHVQIGCPADDAAAGTCVDGPPWRSGWRRHDGCRDAARPLVRWADRGDELSGAGKRDRIRRPRARTPRRPGDRAPRRP